jgi:hypothetical protein
MYKVLCFCSIAFLCTAGQMPRKEAEPVPSTQEVATQEAVATQEEPVAKIERRSAAKRSMDAPIENEARKGAAKKVVEEASSL